MKHGHVTGTKRERKSRQQTVDRYKMMGAAIQAKLASKSVAELLSSMKNGR